MKMAKKLLSLVLTFMFLVNFSAFGFIQVYAHSSMLEVGYDDCISSTGNGDDEAWYILNRYNKNTMQIVSCPHFSHEETTIKYYFADTSADGTYSWTTDVSEAVANDIKLAYANSMKKWNNVYFYSYDDSTGNIVKNKIINVVEGLTAADSNIIIYPKNSDSVASTSSKSGYNFIEKIGTIAHSHWSKWAMKVNVNYFYYGGSVPNDDVGVVRERTGAHELGHVLGLSDVDVEAICGADDATDHHEEILMGYGSPMSARSSDITYKDIAGVAITRGFHTDNDHKWLNAGLQSDGTYKLICSICNGVKYVSSLSGYTYNTYGACNNNHSLSSGNMMAVASYGNKDYYKCKYCRYVAPFSDIVEQDYSATYVASERRYLITNNVAGLSYSFLEEHIWSSGSCVECGFEHTDHLYSYWSKNGTYHFKSCRCGYTTTEAHFVKSSDIVNGRYAVCIGCGRSLDLLGDIANVWPTNITKMSINGSYILPNGIVVLVDEDIEAYMNGTLQFYDRDDVPTTE